MTADLKPCPFCGEKVEMHDYTHAHVAAWVMIHRCQVVGVIHLENYSGTRLAEVWNTRAPTVSDTGADSGPGASTSQPGEAPRSDAPALPTHYGAARIQTVQRDFGALRDAIRAHDSEAAETAWDRCERWLGLWPLEQTTPPASAPSTPVDNKISADPVGKEGG